MSFWHRSTCFHAADDFQPEQPTVVTSVTFWLIATHPLVPFNWSFSVHRSVDDDIPFGFAPQYDWFRFETGPESVIDLGTWKGRDGTHLFEVRFDDLNLLLDPADTVEGTYWFSPGGWSNDFSDMRSWWLTAGNREVNGHEGWGKHYPFLYPGWKPLSLFGEPVSDWAMRIEGIVIPAPGALAPVLGASLGAIPARRRRGS